MTDDARSSAEEAANTDDARSSAEEAANTDDARSSAEEAANPRTLVVKATAGADAPERCAQAFTVAATAVSAGVTVSLWLTGESSWFALPGRAETFELPHSAPLADLLAAVLAGGTVTLCTQCAARRAIGPDDVVAGVRIAGAAAFVEECLAPGAQALVY